ncbi:MAG: hypothetical protein K2M96_07845 [Prevotella sp.]|nr:hypothetical protein [Prevotella sp.]
MKRLITLLMSVMLLSGLAKLSAQTPITVTVPPFGDKVKLQTLKTGIYRIDYVIGDDGSSISASGILLVINHEGESLKVGINVMLFPSKKKVCATSMNTIQGWMVADGNKYVTYDMEKGDSKASIGYGMVWGYSKKYQVFKVQGGGRSATVVYDPKSYKKMDEEEVLKAIFKIDDTPGSISIIP